MVIVDNYDMLVGRMLTSGCDVWLNNPLRPQEASGTSGMKPPLHGGINCSILDGWWPECFNGKNGWKIGDGREFTDRQKQDRYDANAIYELLENEIVPIFYNRDRSGIPRQWVRIMLESMKTVGSEFNTHRMVREYWRKYYQPASGGQAIASGTLIERSNAFGLAGVKLLRTHSSMSRVRRLDSSSKAAGAFICAATSDGDAGTPTQFPLQQSIAGSGTSVPVTSGAEMLLPKLLARMLKSSALTVPS